MRRLLLAGMSALAVTVVVMAQSPVASDRDWKRWLDDVGPLLTAAEKSNAKKVAAQDRDSFRESFWARRNPNGKTADNPQRAEFELRVRNADKRFRVNGNGAWNDCGRAFVILGKPDKIDNRVNATHFAASDQLSAFREQDDVEAEVWIYRDSPRLPPSPQGYNFRFTQKCEALNGPPFQRLLESAAASYVVER